MKGLIFSLVALLGLAFAQGFLRGMLSEELDEFWMNYKKKYGKSYDDDDEEIYRRSIWEKNLNYIAKHNIRYDLGQEIFNLGINEYSDLTLNEYKKTLLGFKQPPENVYSNNGTKVFDIENDIDLPATVDWRSQGYVTPIKNQGSCGSCWAFSSTGALEGQHFRKSHQLVSLSEQNLVDCTKSNMGCNGGWMNFAFQYVATNGGIDTERGYPYQAVTLACRYKVSARGATCNGFTNIAKSESALMAAVATIGPIAVAIDAGHASFQSYRSGVYNEPACTTTIDHAVLVVGYGTTSQGQPYWLVKNSWGTSWGMQGYIMMSRNRGNQCGIANYASYPTM